MCFELKCSCANFTLHKLYFQQDVLCTKCTSNKNYFTYDVHSVYFSVDWVTVLLRHRHVLFLYDEVFSHRNLVVFALNFLFFDSTHLARLVMSTKINSFQEHFDDTHIILTCCFASIAYTGTQTKQYCLNNMYNVHPISSLWLLWFMQQFRTQSCIIHGFIVCRNIALKTYH